MSVDWESKFTLWAKPPSNTEEQRSSNAVNMIQNAIRQSSILSNRHITISVQGSYRNNTNVRQDSDVDIAVICSDSFFHYLPEGYTPDMFGFIPATYLYPEFKNQIGDALTSYLGSNIVLRGNKAFNIHENTYHVDADVAPFFEHRRYDANGNYLSGVELRPDNIGRIINWPDQHYDNGVNKNLVTQRRFKRIVRILKALCNEMADNGIATVTNIPGFLIECLVWNVPNDHFGYSTYVADVQSSLAFLFNNTMNDKDCAEGGEVSELKYLFRKSQKWTRPQAHSFLSEAWDYIGFQ